MKNGAPLQYTDAPNHELFTKYVEVRRRVYFNEYPWLPSDFGQEDEVDRTSHIILAVQCGVLAGGARLTISTPGGRRPLPLEESGFSLRVCPQLGHLDLERYSYGEISRMAVEPACANGFEVSSGLGNMLCAKAAHEGLDVVFCICPEKPARINRMNARRRGVPFDRYLELTTVFGVNMWLCAFGGLLKVYGSRGEVA